MFPYNGMRKKQCVIPLINNLVHNLHFFIKK